MLLLLPVHIRFARPKRLVCAIDPVVYGELLGQPLTSKKVSRIAYLSSDVVVSVQPSLAGDSAFSPFLKRYAGRQDKGVVAARAGSVPEVRVVSARDRKEAALTFPSPCLDPICTT